MYETFAHTADLGLRVTAPDLPTLLAEAGRGLCSVLVENIEDVRPTKAVELTIDGSEADYLLFDWLSELLYRFEGHSLLLTEFDIRLTDSGLNAIARGEPVDRSRHQLAHEVKAITYHGLTVEQTPDGWRGEVIVDI